jgi:hypothetical protein
LPPRPITRHDVAILSILTIEFLICCVINVAFEVRACQDVLDYLARVPVPNIILCGLPLRSASCRGERAFVLEIGVFPAHVAKLNCIDLPVKILMVGDRGSIAVRDERGSPQFEEPVNLFL